MDGFSERNEAYRNAPAVGRCPGNRPRLRPRRLPVDRSRPAEGGRCRTDGAGAAHAGWKGAFTGVLEATVDAMVRLGSRRGDIMACLGPTISAAAYEVGPEFVARFREAGEEVDRWFAPSTRTGHAMFDLPGYIVFRLERAGIRATNLALCTYGDEARFFSYRRMTLNHEPDYGRHLAAIAIEGG